MSPATRSTDMMGNATVTDSSAFDSSFLGGIIAALDYYYIPVLIAVGLIGKFTFYHYL